MKKALCMIALAAISFGAFAATTPTKSLTDTVKAKTKMKHGNMKQKIKTPHSKVKTKMKDTSKRG